MTPMRGKLQSTATPVSAKPTRLFKAATVLADAHGIGRVAEALTEGLIYFLVLFTPWAFGTTQPWSIWVLNSGGYALGGLLLTKWLTRRSPPPAGVSSMPLVAAAQLREHE